MTVTIKDIAKAAGVSHTTVSRALNGNPAISTQTTKRIRDLAQQMGYTPSAVAQSLLSQRTLTIGIVVTSIADPFFAQVVEGVENEASAAGYSVFLTTSHNDPQREIQVVSTLHRRRVDAVIVTSSNVGGLYASELDQIQVPIVLINNQGEGKHLYSVSVDDQHGAKLATEYLISLGHRRIGYLGTHTRQKSNRRRLLGYQQALTEAGIELDESLVTMSEILIHVENEMLAFSTIMAAKPTAIVCYNDLMAIGVLNACRQHGVRVPEDMSVIGFDDIEYTTYVTPKLTSIRQPRYKMGELAMQMALALIADEQDVHNKMLRGELIARESTAPASK